MTNQTEAYQAALDIFKLYFALTDQGGATREDMLQWLDTHIDALKRHDQDPTVIQILETFCEELLGLNKVDSKPLRESLRLQMTWTRSEQP